MYLLDKIARGAQKYLRYRDGHIAVFTALIGLPLLLMVSVAMDMGNASAKRANLVAGIDAAALAAVIPANLTNDERIAYAKKAFTENYFGKEKVALDVKATRERVDIEAHIQVPTLLSGMVGKDFLDVRERASAVLTTNDVICALALDPSSAQAVTFKGQNVFKAPECSVQVNSSSPEAMISTASTPPSAKSFCVYGSHTGTYSPPARSNCTKIDDPYQGVPIPVSGPCDYVNYEAKQITTVLKPGTYCGGIRINKSKVTFNPGLYVIEDGPFQIVGASDVKGSGVSFALKGPSSFYSSVSQARIDLTAPATGTYKGLVIFQDKASNPGSTSTISGGTYVRLVGTLYFPTHVLNIGGNGDLGTLSEATSYIAYRLNFAGRSLVEIHVDHESGGIPPLLPRSDEGARLVK
ncbi:MAG: hypothetical protein HKO02_08895 [Hyphomonadaceae bacterium]|nr:hypothetical protein [Hyphomonadaceae bacterium]